MTSVTFRRMWAAITSRLTIAIARQRAANGGHRTRFMIALAQFLKVSAWVKATARTVLGYRDAAQTAASGRRPTRALRKPPPACPAMREGQFRLHGERCREWGHVVGCAEHPHAGYLGFRHGTDDGGPDRDAVALGAGRDAGETDRAGAVGVFRTGRRWRRVPAGSEHGRGADFSALVTEWRVTRTAGTCSAVPRTTRSISTASAVRCASTAVSSRTA